MAPDPQKVAELQRKYTGLDGNLSYISGHTIATKYDGYKNANQSAGAASTDYTKTAKGLKATKPYQGGATGPVGGSLYYQAGHATLAPLAGTAATTAQYHAERRDSFNTKYADVLEAKGEYDGHVQQAKCAHNSAAKYSKFQTQHEKYKKRP
ncbi:hypothetical protein GGR54DRAFT_178810 [Hypoxylon sp. NC1633]|nr:hypothetical protein GGR54DRAFT_178810 [Hypoxylon sp. NC1633]